jgi:crotonobetainyl-CoA:carnitine CoA-transferase CaiB-like acyl-CoA transferase
LTADATPETAPVGPLAGIRVIDFTRWFAGPLATSFMGDMGADVVKIERPKSPDGTRNVDSLFGPGTSSYFLGLNRNKRSVAVDYQVPAGREVVLDLIRGADVVIANFRPGVMDSLGLGYEALRELRPGLVYCEISSFGHSGPLRSRPGMDLVVQAMGGIMGVTGEAGARPTRVGSPIADYIGALQALIGVASALLARERTGVGQRVDVALLDGQVAGLANYIPGFFVTGKPDGPVGVSHPQLVPYQMFDTADGRVIVACLTEEFWQRLCGALGLPELIDDERFRLNADRVAHRAEIVGILERVLAGMTTAEVIARLEVADVPFAPIHSIGDVVSHPQVLHNQMIVEMKGPGDAVHHVVGTPVKFSGTPASVRSPGPALGQQTVEVLRSLGLGMAAISELERSGIIYTREQEGS